MPRWSLRLRRRVGRGGESRGEGVIGTYLPEIVYGATDGIVTTFAIVSSIVGAGLSMTTILILGFASLFADAVSMAVGNVLSERSKPGHPPTLREASHHGAATLAGFIFAGILPLLAYVLPEVAVPRFALAGLLAATALFGIGAFRSVFTELTALRGGAEMLLLGLAAGSVAFAVGRFGAMLVEGAG